MIARLRGVAVLTAVSFVALGGAGSASAQTGIPAPTNDPIAVAFSPSGGLLATANDETDTVSVFAVGAGGQLREVLGSPFRTGGVRPVSVAFNRSGDLLAVANNYSGNVSVFSVGPGGALTPVAGSPFAVPGPHPSSVAFSPTRPLLAVTVLSYDSTISDTVAMFSVGAGGALTRVPGSPFDTGAFTSPDSVSFSRNGDLLATANFLGQSLSVFSVGPDGALTPAPGSPHAQPPSAFPFAVSFSPTRDLLAGANFSSQSVSMSSVGSAGALTPVPGSPFAQPPNSYPSSVSFSPTRDLLATANYNSDSVSMSSVAANGALAPVAGSPFAAGGYPRSVAFSPNGGLVAVANWGGASVSVFSVGADGALVPAAGSPFRLRLPTTMQQIIGRIPGTPYLVSDLPGAAVWNSASTLLAVPNGDQTGVEGVYVFSVAPDGTFTPVPGSPFKTGPRPSPLAGSAAFSLDGRLLAIANEDGDSVSMFSVDGDKLTQVTGSPFPVGERPVAVVFSPNGAFLAILQSGGGVSMFSVGDGGTLSGQPVSHLDFPCCGGHNLAFNPRGTLLAAASDSNRRLTMISVGPGGKLAEADSVETGENPWWATFDPDGKVLAVTSEYRNTVALFSVDDHGMLTQIPGSPFGVGYGPRGVAFSPDGELLSVANYWGSTLSVFSLGGGHRGLAAASDRGIVRRRQDPVLPDIPGSPIDTLPVEPFSVEFSPNGHFLATSDASSFEGFSIWAPTGPLEIRKRANHSEVTPGEVLRYTLTVHNPNAYPVTATVTDDLANILDTATYRHDAHASIPTVTVDPVTRLLTWRGNLLAGHTAVIRYSVRINADASGIVTNRVLGPPTASCGPPAPELPCVTETPIVPPPGPGADLSLTKVASTDSTHPGAQVLYTLVVENHGPRRATGVTVHDPVPAGLFLHSAKPSQGTCTLSAGDLTCHLGSIVSGGKALVLVEATVAQNASGTVTNVANVHGDQHDPHPGNNTDRSTITVIPWTERETVADLVVVKHGPGTVTQGHAFRYTITVTNKGPDNASDVTLIDAAQLPLRVVSIHPSQGHCQTGPPIRCALGTLDKGAHVSITVTAIAPSAGHQVNSAVVMSPGWDSGPGDNLGESETTIRPAPVPAPPPFTG